MRYTQNPSKISANKLADCVGYQLRPADSCCVKNTQVLLRGTMVIFCLFLLEILEYNDEMNPLESVGEKLVHVRYDGKQLRIS